VKVPYTIQVSNQIPTRNGPAKSPTAQPAFTLDNLSEKTQHLPKITDNKTFRAVLYCA
jgi:hypothetical protein